VNVYLEFILVVICLNLALTWLVCLVIWNISVNSDEPDVIDYESKQSNRSKYFEEDFGGCPCGSGLPYEKCCKNAIRPL